MADSQSLTLLPPKPAAAPTSETTTKKATKPTPDKSFGHKLDKATKQIVAKKVDLKAVAVPAKPALTAAKTPKDPAAVDPDAKEQLVDPTTKQPGLKLPKPGVNDPADTDAKEDEEKSATETVEPAVVKPATPTKQSAEGPKKAAKKVDLKTTVIKPPAQPVVTKAQADQTANSASEASASDLSKTDDDADDSTDAIDSANNGVFGSGKVVGKGVSTDANTTVINAAANAADDQNTAGDAADESDPLAVAAAEVATTDDESVVKTATAPESHTPGVTTDITSLAASTTGNSSATVDIKASAAVSTASAQVRFAEDNHPKIITGIAGELLPKGGTLQLQLNPADLGALQVTVHIQDGVVSASFETSNDNATKMLSHSLGQLKSGLEAAGVSVEKLHVEQAPQKDASKDSNSESDSKSPLQDQQRQAQQDQQRKDMVQRMWRRLAGGSDPLDLVA